MTTYQKLRALVAANIPFQFSGTEIRASYHTVQRKFADDLNNPEVTGFTSWGNSGPDGEWFITNLPPGKVGEVLKKFCKEHGWKVQPSLWGVPGAKAGWTSYTASYGTLVNVTISVKDRKVRVSFDPEALGH